MKHKTEIVDSKSELASNLVKNFNAIQTAVCALLAGLSLIAGNSNLALFFFVGAIISGIFPPWFLRKFSFKSASRISLTWAYLLSTSVIFVTGGPNSHNILWLIGMPILSIYFRGSRGGLKWIFLSFTIATGLFSLQFIGFQFPNALTSGNEIQLLWGAFAVTFFTVARIAHLSENARSKNYELLANENRQRRSSEQNQKFVNMVLAIVAKGSDQDLGLKRLAENYEGQFQNSGCIIFSYDEAKGKFHSPVSNNVSDQLEAFLLEDGTSNNSSEISLGNSLLQKALKSKEVEVNTQLGSCPTLKPNLNTKKNEHLSSWVYAVRGSEKTPIGVIVIIHYTETKLDTAHRKLIESMSMLSGIIIENRIKSAASRDLQAKVFHSSKLASIGVLAAGVAHEINNPLAIINGYMGILEDSIDDGDFTETSGRSVVNSVRQSVNRIGNIVNGLKQYSRVDEIEFEILDPHELFSNTISLVEQIYRKEAIDLSITLTPQNCAIRGNKGKIQQILINLLSNAKDAVENSSEKLIKVTTQIDHLDWKISISDSGTGIASENLTKIFDTFYTTKPVGKGTGLGLGISYALAKEMAGNIEVVSSEGEGSTFSLTIPLSEDIERPDQNPDNIDSEKASRMIHPTQTSIVGSCLIVDDEEDIRFILKEYISKIGLKVTTAEDGGIALEILKKQSFDIIITDIKMPNMDGVTLIEESKKFVPKETSFVILSGADILDELIEKQKTSTLVFADAYIEKPFSKSGIQDALNTILNGRNAA